MSDRTPSRTALGTAYLRAAHQVLDAPPHILEDPLAVSLLGEQTVQRIAETPEKYHSTARRLLRAHVVLRSRFTEDRLALAVFRGVTQYIIIGAGFDTFALRQPAWARALTIVEVDQLSTQEQKRSMIKAAGYEIPSNVFFAGLDLETESLEDGLAAHRISVAEPTFFSWLGVTMYLHEEAIDAVLRSAARFPARSEIVLTFLQPPMITNACGERSSSSLARRVESIGEPFISYFTPEAIEAKLHCAGFSMVEFLTKAEAKARYFAHRSDDLPVPERTALVSAIR